MLAGTHSNVYTYEYNSKLNFIYKFEFTYQQIVAVSGAYTLQCSDAITQRLVQPQ